MDEAVVEAQVVSQTGCGSRRLFGQRGRPVSGRGTEGSGERPAWRQVQVLMDGVQQPQQELLGVVLRGATVLDALPAHDGAELVRRLRLRALRPQGLEQVGQRFRHVSAAGTGARVRFAVLPAVQPVAVGHEELGQRLRVGQALHHGVHEARVALVLEAAHGGHLHVRSSAITGHASSCTAALLCIS